MKKFDVHWVSYNQQHHYIIGKLTYNKYNTWVFEYFKETVKEAISFGFRPFPDMPDLEKQYISSKLFQVFEVRYLLKHKSPIIYAMQTQDASLVTDKVYIKSLEGVNK